jgi:glycosyltransferase involved in cell wall biosynthesis
MTSLRGRPDAIAVVIPVRDGAAFLAAAIDSVIAQVGNHVEEIVVVDDGSRDESAAIARSRAGVRCISQPPLGDAV